MLGTGERVRAGMRPVGFSAAVYRHVLLIQSEVQAGSPVLASISLAALALVVQTLVLNSPGHFRPAPNPLFAVAVCFGTLLSLALTLAAASPLRDLLYLRARQSLCVAGLLSLGILTFSGIGYTTSGIVSIVSGNPYTNDGAVFDLYAAQQVRHGHNPYDKTNIVKALAAINAPAITTTPLQEGQFRGARAYPSEVAVEQVFMNTLRYRPRTIPPEFESKYNYPSGSFLFILPFVYAGLHDMRFLYALAFILMGVYLWIRMPRTLRPVVPFLIIGDAPVVALTAGGQPDPLYGLFLMLGYAEWATPWLSPLALGIAVGTKQLAWFFVPFYLLLILRQFGLAEALRRISIMALVFALMNGIFILWSPSSYVNSIAAPMSDPMFPLGVGIVSLFVSNVLPMVPKAAFTVAELLSFAGGFLADLRLRSLPAATGIVLGALPLFFAYRSLVNYFYLVPLLALAVIVAAPHQRRT